MHVAVRPGWRCRECGDEWPCAPARVEMLADYRGRPTALRVLMWANLEVAAGELKPADSAAFFGRFLYWTSAV